MALSHVEKNFNISPLAGKVRPHTFIININADSSVVIMEKSPLETHPHVASITADFRPGAKEAVREHNQAHDDGDPERIVETNNLLPLILRAHH